MSNAPVIGLLLGIFMVVIFIRFEVADIKSAVYEIRAKLRRAVSEDREDKAEMDADSNNRIRQNP